MNLVQELSELFTSSLGHNKVITRFPPSPTGYFHIGSARTALFNYLFSRHHGGTMYLRFEDTDKARSKKEFEDDILEGLAWLGIEYTMPDIARQSERIAVYKKYFETLLQKGAAYEAEESKGEPGKKVVRFKNPNIRITFNDLIRGEVSFDTKELGDFIIAKNTEEPLYHLAVVIDDYEMGVTHIIRGEDHISNTPRQILILEALGFPRPHYAHIPLILAPDRTKLSKRHGATSLREYKNMGYLPEAIFNYLALLGWNPGGEQELFSQKELIRLFDLERVHKSGAVFDIEKLKWFNHTFLQQLPVEDQLHKIIAILPQKITTLPQYSKERLLRMIPTLMERIHTLGEIADMAEAGSLDYFFKVPTLNKDEIAWHKDTDTKQAKKHLAAVRDLLAELSEQEFSEEKIKERVWEYATKEGKGSVLWPVRYALSGTKESPDPFTLGFILGKHEALERLDRASATIAE